MSGTRRKAGVLASQVDGYQAWLTTRGYTPSTIRNMLKDLGQLGLWLPAQGLEVTQLDEERAAAFLAAHRSGHRRKVGVRALAPLLEYLREVELVLAVSRPITPLDELLERYRRWMVQERGLAASTVLRYENTARRFLHEQAEDGDLFDPARLTGADVNAFLLRECDRVSAGSVKGRVAELRSVLRFLYLGGLTPLRLGSAVPPVGGWRLATLPPPAMTAATVQLLLDSCDRGTDVGVRDFAILALIARLGLRSIEVTPTTWSRTRPLSFFTAFAYAFAYFVVTSARDCIDSSLLMPQQRHRFAGIPT